VSDGAPIVVGALGGSGTRVAAQALIDSGAYLGSTFNGRTTISSSRPGAELQRLLEFARLPCDDAIADRLAAGVRPTGSIGRWRAHGEEFTPEQLAAVESFGFEVR
jgi:hypothetical protein